VQSSDHQETTRLLTLGLATKTIPYIPVFIFYLNHTDWKILLIFLQYQ